MAIFRGTGGTGDSTTDTTVTTVTEKAAEAASSATSAANSATSASNSATSAETSATNAATSESNAATSESNASTSATSAETAKTAAEAAQTAAETAETNAETAEANAVTAKNQAVSAKDNAVTAQTAAETAETNAETAYSNTLAIFGDAQDVQDAVDSASASATTATTKASEAATSATNAANSATSAGTSETNAASSASQAATSANTAGSHATDAETAKDAAETAQAAAEAAEANINGLYLGSLADDPTLDGNGVAVTTGDLYFNTTEQEVRVYTDGDVWEPVVDLAGDITVNSLTSNNDVVVKGNLEVQGTTITVDSATAQTIDLGDNDKIRLGDTDDLQIYHDGTDSYIANTTGTLKLSGNTDVTGNITVSGTVDGRDIATDGATLDAVASTYVDVSGDTLTGDLAFGDNVKAKFGAGDDLQIYHDGSYSYVSDQGTGDLLLQGNNLRLVNYPWTKNYLTATNGGHLNLYYDGAVKLATTSSGVDVTGTLVSDGLTVDQSGTGTIGNVELKTISSFDTSNALPSIGRSTTSIGGSGTGTLVIQGRSDLPRSVIIATGDTSTSRFHENGDISFYDDAGTSQDFFWDASTSRLGLGTTSPVRELHVVGGNDTIRLQSTGANTKIEMVNTTSSTNEFGFLGANFFVSPNGSEAMRIDSSGRLLIGTSSSDPWRSAQDVIQLGDNGSVSHYEGLLTTLNHNYYIDSSGNVKYSQTGQEAFTINLNSYSNAIEFKYAPSGTAGDTFSWNTAAVIDTNGRLGIGTTSPQETLQIKSSSNGDGLRIQRDSTITNDYAQLSFLTSTSDTFTPQSWIRSFRQANPDYSELTFGANNTERMRIDSDGRVGIGTTSPSSKLTVDTGGAGDADYIDINSSGTGRLRIGYAFTAAPTNTSYAQILTDTTGNLDLSTRGNNASNIQMYTSSGSTPVERMRITSDGKVGIGTASPATNSKLTLDNADSLYTLAIRGTTKGLRIGTSSGAATIQATDNTLTGSYQPLQVEGSQVIFSKSGSEAARIDSSGRLGIGTTSPSDEFHVRNANHPRIRIDATNTGQNANLLFINSTDGLYAQIENEGSGLKFLTQATERMRIDSNGRLGINTTSPDTDVNIKLKGSSSANKLFIESSGSSNYGLYLSSAYSENMAFIGATNSSNGDFNGARIGFIDYGRALQFSVNQGASQSEAARIDSSGNLLVGKTSNTFSTAGFAFEGTAGHVTTDGATSFAFNRLTSNGDIAAFYKDSTKVGSISTSGGTTSYNTTSDYRLKENVTEINGASDRLNELQVKRFNLIGHDQTVDGFLAHEVQDVVPQAVTGSKDEVDADGNPVYQSIDHSKLVPLLTAALQEALSEIDSLKNRVTELEARA